jgi:ATP-dependent Clp protease ATP-binding subunit ClpB
LRTGRSVRSVETAGDGNRPRPFPPEFLNRLDEIVLFHRLGRSEMAPIVDIQVGRLGKLLKDRKITLDLTPRRR